MCVYSGILLNMGLFFMFIFFTISELGHPSRLCQTTRLVEPNVYVNSRDRLRAGRPYTVPEEGEEFSGENSNQTMSSMSSHYVYFKTAETDTEPPNE